MVGYWCLHCETATEAQHIKRDSDGDRECPFCGAGIFDLWKIEGGFKTGDVIPTGSDFVSVLFSTYEDNHPDTYLEDDA